MVLTLMVIGDSDDAEERSAIVASWEEVGGEFKDVYMDDREVVGVELWGSK